MMYYGDGWPQGMTLAGQGVVRVAILLDVPSKPDEFKTPRLCLTFELRDGKRLLLPVTAFELVNNESEKNG